MQPDRPPGPNAYDAGLSAARDAVDNIGVWVAIWEARREPDAFARSCASKAIAAADELLAATHGIRATLITETGQADRDAAARADELLAKTRDGPRETEDRRNRAPAAPRPKASADEILDRGEDKNRAPRAPRAGPAGELEPAELEAAP